MKSLFYPGQHQMNPSASASKFKPKQKKPFIVNVEQLTKHEENTFKMIFEEWTNTPTLNLLLDKWSNYRNKTLSMLNRKASLSM
ncbi:unnamed protein product, partial [Rotaria socialis]